MASKFVGQADIAYSDLMHDTINQISSVMSIAQFCLISKEMSPEVQSDMKRIVKTMRQISDNLRRLSEIWEED